MRNTFALLALSCVSLMGCNQPSDPIVGGPCSYVTLSEEAFFVDEQDGLVTLKAANRDYVIEAKFFESPPQKGDRFMVTSDQITEGTCTPVMIEKVEKL